MCKMYVYPLTHLPTFYVPTYLPTDGRTYIHKYAHLSNYRRVNIHFIMRHWHNIPRLCRSTVRRTPGWRRTFSASSCSIRRVHFSAIGWVQVNGKGGKSNHQSIFVGQTPVYMNNMSVDSHFEKWIVDFLQQIEDVPQTDNGFPPTCKHSKWSSPYSCPKLGRFRTKNRADLGVSAKLGTVYPKMLI